MSDEHQDFHNRRAKKWGLDRIIRQSNSISSTFMAKVEPWLEVIFRKMLKTSTINDVAVNMNGTWYLQHDDDWRTYTIILDQKGSVFSGYVVDIEQTQMDGHLFESGQAEFIIGLRTHAGQLDITNMNIQGIWQNTVGNSGKFTLVRRK